MALEHGSPARLPSGTNLLVHILYLQEILQTPEINIVFWTLTYEIQFYLVVALSKWAETLLSNRRMSGENVTTALTYLQTALALAAVFASTSWLPRGIFVIYWHGFFIGVLAYGAGYLRRPPYLLFLLSVVMLVKAPSSPQVFNTPCVGTAMFLFLAARGSYLVDGLRSQAWQRLGDLSYSLYLVHGPVIVLGFGVWTRLCGHGALQDAAGFVIVTSGTLVVAGIFWIVIEQPSHRLSRRIRLFQ